MPTFLEELFAGMSNFGADKKFDFDFDFFNAPYDKGDKDVNAIAEAGFNVNRFIRDQMDRKAPQGTVNPNDLTREEAMELYYDPYSGDGDMFTPEEEAERTWEQAKVDYNKEFGRPSNAKMSSQHAELAPVIGAGAGLLKLGELEAAEGAITAKQNFQDPSLYRVNATNGAANFLAEDGGVVGRLNLSGILNPSKMDKIGKYHYGGYVNNEPVGNYDTVSERISRYVGGDPQQLAPVQTESGGKGKEEMIILPSLDILPVNATMRHSKMQDDEVTDLLPENSYIASQFGFNLKREEAANIVTEVGVKPYNIFGGNSVPLEQTLASMFDKKEQSPSDVVRNIKKKFEIVDGNDPFTLAANDENRLNSLPYLQGVIIMSEEEKKRKAKSNTKGDGKIQVEEGAGTYPELDPSQVFANGGRVMRSNNTQNAFLGALIGGGLLQGASALYGLYNSGKEKKEIKRIQAINEKDIDNLAEKQSANNAMGAGVGIASILAQDTKIEGPQLEIQRLLQRQSQLSPDLINGMSNQYFNSAPIQDAFSNTGNFQRGVAAGALNFGQAQANANQLQYNNAAQGLERSNKFSAEIQNIINQQKGIDTSTANQNRAARNSQLSGLGGIGMGYFNTDSNIQGAQTNAQIANRGTAQAALSQVNAAQRQSVQNVANMGTQMAMSYAQNKAAQPKVQTPRSRESFGDMPDFSNYNLASDNINLRTFDEQGVNLSNMTGQPQGMNLSNMLNQPANFSLNYNGQTPDVSNINGGTFSQADSDYFMNNMQYMNKGSFNMDSQGLQTLPTLNSSGVQSNYNSPQNMLPTNNYTGCYQNLYYVNGNYTQPC
jgi:hypothetical protein